MSRVLLRGWLGKRQTAVQLTELKDAPKGGGWRACRLQGPSQRGAGTGGHRGEQLGRCLGEARGARPVFLEKSIFGGQEAGLEEERSRDGWEEDVSRRKGWTRRAAL